MRLGTFEGLEHDCCQEMQPQAFSLLEKRVSARVSKPEMLLEPCKSAFAALHLDCSQRLYSLSQRRVVRLAEPAQEDNSKKNCLVSEGAQRCHLTSLLFLRLPTAHGGKQASELTSATLTKITVERSMVCSTRPPV